MKKIATIIVGLLCITNNFALDPVSTFTVSGGTITCRIYTEQPKNNYYKLMINIPTYEGDFDMSVNMNIQSQDIDTVISSLEHIRDKYAEWSNVATENKVQSFSKPIPFAIPNLTFTWMAGERFGTSKQTVLVPNFEISTDKPAIISFSSKLTSIDNKYLTKDLKFEFCSVEEIQAFIDALNPDIVNRLYNKEVVKDSTQIAIDNLFN